MNASVIILRRKKSCIPTREFTNTASSISSGRNKATHCSTQAVPPPLVCCQYPFLWKILPPGVSTMGLSVPNLLLNIYFAVCLVIIVFFRRTWFRTFSNSLTDSLQPAPPEAVARSPEFHPFVLSYGSGYANAF